MAGLASHKSASDLGVSAFVASESTARFIPPRTKFWRRHCKDKFKDKLSLYEHSHKVVSCQNDIIKQIV